MEIVGEEGAARENIAALEKGKTNERYVGIEILRLISMLLITCVHLLNYGGFLKSAEGTELFFLRVLYAFFTPSVNVFFLITGYFCVQKSTIAWKKIMRLWLSVVFYSVALNAAFAIAYGDAFDFESIVKCFLPLLFEKYWFFTTYMLLYLLTPFLNAIFRGCGKRAMTLLVIGICICSYAAKRFPLDKITGFGSGYNLAWAVALYIIGGYLRLYPIMFRFAAPVYLLCIALLVFFYYYPVSEHIVNTTDYTAPATLVASMCLLLCFKDVKSTRLKWFDKAILFISPSIFGVYLFQEAEIAKPHIYFDILKVENYYASGYKALIVISLALAIFAMGLLIDLLRRLIFSAIKKPLAKISASRK